MKQTLIGVAAPVGDSPPSSRAKNPMKGTLLGVSPTTKPAHGQMDDDTRPEPIPPHPTRERDG
jgi:hypothetical protein